MKPFSYVFIKEIILIALIFVIIIMNDDDGIVGFEKKKIHKENV